MYIMAISEPIGLLTCFFITMFLVIVVYLLLLGGTILVVNEPSHKSKILILSIAIVLVLTDSEYQKLIDDIYTTRKVTVYYGKE